MTFFKGVFQKYVVHIFKILAISKRGWFEQLSDENLKNGTLKRFTLVRKSNGSILNITWVCRRGLDGSRTLEVHYLARSDHVFNFLVYLENITTHLHFRDFGHSQKGCLSERQNGKSKNDVLVITFQNDIKKYLHTKVLRRGLDGSWLVGFWYLTRKDHGFNFWGIWKI